MLPAGPITRATVVQFVSDDTGGCFRSLAAYAGPAVGPQLMITASRGYIQISWPATATGYRLQHCTDLRVGNWVDNTASPSGYGTEQLTVSEPASEFRFYRLIKPQY